MIGKREEELGVDRAFHEAEFPFFGFFKRHKRCVGFVLVSHHDSLPRGNVLQLPGKVCFRFKNIHFFTHEPSLCAQATTVNEKGTVDSSYPQSGYKPDQ